MPAYPIINLIGIALIILANAFFATVEFALVSARRTWLESRAAQGNTRAKTALHLIGNLNAVVSGTQVGITMTSLALGWMGEITLSQVIEPALSLVEADSAWIVHSLATLLTFVGLTFLHVVLGELVPKQIALGRAERLSLLVAWPMNIFLKIVRGPQALLHASSYSIARHLGANPSGSPAHSYSGEELKMLVTTSQRSGALPAYQQEMIHNVIDLSQVSVREVMVPRPNIVSVPIDSKLDDLIRMETEDLHSRLPVFENAPEQIVGVLYAKDLFRIWREREADRKMGRSSKSVHLRTLVREITVVPESKPIDQLLQEFQKNRRHIALVVDEFGNTVGLITIEDILEQIVGEIEDEYDWERPPGVRLGESKLILDGQINILDLENQYDVDLPRDKGFETLAGFVLYQLGHIPQPSQSFRFGEWKFTVLETEDHRIAQVEIERLEPGMDESRKS
jgi:putative hemolysin